MFKKYILFFLTLLFSNENIDYKINVWGIPAAKCSYSIIDTIFHDIPSKKIQYKVETISLYDFFYPVKNNYTVIFNSDTYSLLYYEKNSSQPQVINNITTNYNNGIISYINGDVVKENETNIFILLYLIGNNNFKAIDRFPIIDREGKKFSYSLTPIKENYSYSISLNPISNFDLSVVEHTDIFTWGLFLENTKNFVYINNNDKLIDKCIFKKGIIKLVATRVK